MSPRAAYGCSAVRRTATLKRSWMSRRPAQFAEKIKAETTRNVAIICDAVIELQ